MATAPSPNDLTRQQLDELDDLLQRMLNVPVTAVDPPPPASTAGPPTTANWRADPPAPGPVPAPHLAPVELPRPPARAPKVTVTVHPVAEPALGTYSPGSPVPLMAPPEPAVPVLAARAGPQLAPASVVHTPVAPEPPALGPAEDDAPIITPPAAYRGAHAPHSPRSARHTAEVAGAPASVADLTPGAEYEGLSTQYTVPGRTTTASGRTTTASGRTTTASGRTTTASGQPTAMGRAAPASPTPHSVLGTPYSPFLWPLVAFDRVVCAVLGLLGPPGWLLRSGFGKNLLGLAGAGLVLYTAAHVAADRGLVALPFPLPWPR